MAVRLLIVDDHQAVREGIRSLLARRRDWSVCGEAADGLEAVECARRLRPDIILMDMSLPRMDGTEATRIIRRDVPDAKIIVISQDDSASVRQRVSQIGAQAYVSKATLARDLLPAIDLASGQNVASGQNGHESNRVRVSAEGPKVEMDCFAGGGQMSALMHSMDWSRTVLGPPEKWSPALRMMVKFLLANRFPQLLWWGPQFCCLYNDAYIPILGTKHPWALGQPVSDVWLEIWHVLKPLIETPFNGGPATWMEDIPLEINRQGFVEETHFTIAYSPVPDETVPSGIGGVLATVHEITEKVVGERRGQALRDLGARSVEPKSEEEACAIAAETLGRHAVDVPFALFYLLDEKRQVARLVAGTGVDLNDRGCPKIIDLALGAPADLWPVRTVLESEEIQLVKDLKHKFENVPCGSWSDPPNSAAIVPLRAHSLHQFAGFMVAGISSRLQFDQRYVNFLDLMSTQIATTIANARAYEEERKRAEALAELDQAKTAFFSNVSHEFRTPLTLMMSPLEDALAEPQGLSAFMQERLEMAHRNSRRLLKLVNTLLDFSRIEARRIEASYELTDLSLLTAELASVFRSLIERAGMRLIVNCPPLPQMVYVDSEMWEKIVLNLLSNAFKFTLEGEIEVCLQQAGNSVELIVRDTGTGVPVEEIPRLFERFHRVKGARGRSYEGSGIGLALVHELVKLHGGGVRVESKVGHGSRFIVSIPLGNAHLPADRIQAARSLSSTALSVETYVDEAERWAPAGPSMDVQIPGAIKPAAVGVTSAAPAATEKKLLVVADDNADMREYLSHLLQDDYRVHAVCDGLQAIEATRRLRPALVLTDVMMPEMDGFGVVRAIRNDPFLSSTPVILLSARAGEESRVEGLESGADDYLVKPFTTRELLARVASHVKMADLRNETLEAKRRLAAIVESSDDSILTTDLNGVITSCNEGAERLFGYRGQEIIGQPITFIVPPELYESERSILAKVVQGERIRHFESVRLTKHGDKIDVSLTISPLKDAAGRIIGVSRIARDITDRKRAEERLRVLAEGLEDQVRLRTEELEQRNREILTRTEQLRELWNRLVRTQDEERRHIARELHDSVGQYLAGLSMVLSAAKDTTPGNRRIEDATQMTEACIAEVRTISHLLHPPLLEEAGLASTVGWYVEGFAARSGILAEVEIDETFGRLNKDIELALFRVLQESLTNVHRHSGSKTVTIRIGADSERVWLEVEDQGKGSANGSVRPGVGITGMRERIENLTGKLEISFHQSGTRVRVILPLSRETRSAGAGAS